MSRYGYITYLTAVLLALSACGAPPEGGSGYYSSSSVWQNYDVRHPVPSNLNVPPRNAQPTYQENDAIYTQPKKFLCSNNLETDFSCE